MGVLDALVVLDLSTGIAGPLTTMLLGDNGARVTRVEPPQGDRFSALSGYRVWNRGKRNAVLDLGDERDSARLHALVANADVLVHSYRPATAVKLGVDYDTLALINPSLVYCDISAYGEGSPDADRPGYDALVAARTGQLWDVRGVVGGRLGQVSGGEGILPGIEAPEGCWVGPDREGPLFTGVPWPSMGAAYAAGVSINAALRARNITGRGQRVSASLMDGILITTMAGWMQVEKPDAPFFQTWITDPRAPKGFFRASDGRWTHHWVTLPEFILNAAANGMQITDAIKNPRKASLRISPMPEDMLVMHVYQQQCAEAVAQFPADEWTALAGEVGCPVQTVRSPEEALLDPLLVADGCVIEVDDAEVGPIRQVGRVIEFERHSFETPDGARPRGADTVAVCAEADALIAAGRTRGETPPSGVDLTSPLAGITVLDLGLAVAGPYGTQVLAQLGARVIKVNTLTDQFWFSNHIAISCNRDKESIALNLKDPAALAVLYKLVEQADVVQHNMRYEAAERLGVDYESLKKVNPKLVYCHTLGHEQGPRQAFPGNDQTGAALAGTTWLDGGLDNGGRPVWSCTSLGDTGNGLLSAMGITQALSERDRTGEGQMVRTSILYAQLLNASLAWTSPDGAHRGDRPSVDAEQHGWNALYRMYATTDGWICIAALDDRSWRALAVAVGRGELADDPRFDDTATRTANDESLVKELASAFAVRSATEWYAILDDADVPAEVVDRDYVLRLFADPDASRRQVVADFHHRAVGSMKISGLVFHLSDTPGVLQGGAIWPGQDSKSILAELGYTDPQITDLLTTNAVSDTSQ